MKPTLLDLYRSPLCVWVEDPLTHDVLTELWGDPQIHVLVASGNEGVRAMLRARPERVRGKVYGVIDRDFEADNRDRWQLPEVELLRLPAHELENLLLDFTVLSELSGVESAAQIEARARACAEELVYWMACKGVLREMQSTLNSGFPDDPGANIGSLQAAGEYLQKSGYWAGHRAAWNSWSQEQTRLAALQSQEQRLRAELQTGAWQKTFSGKEIFRRLRAAVPKLDATPLRPPHPSSAERDLDLAKRIARKMREQGRIPAELVMLRQVLRNKANL